MAGVFERMGFRAIARHRHKQVTLYRQGEINFILNAEPESFAQRFARLHGPSVCAIAFRVQDAASAYRRATSLGAWGFANQAGPGELNIPAIKGVGDSLIYFVDRWRGKNGAGPGDIGQRIRGNDVSCHLFPVRKLHRNIIRRLNYMSRRQNFAVAGNQHARTESRQTDQSGL